MGKCLTKYLPFCVFIFLFNGFAIKSGSAQNATIRETTESIKTYPFGDPNPVPTLAQNKEHIYPYFTFDQYSVNGKNQKWKVVRLENDFIEVSMLPEVGGKVWGASEKKTGNAFIYKNEVLKFRNIALRGPWTSGGIEFNFGVIGHTPATATPVDYIIQENEDGSVTCTVGALDLPSRTEWRVAVTLPKDKAYFETESLWYNPTQLDQSYYVWMNAAVEAGQDLQFFFPGTHYIGHGGDAHPWPVNNDGVDLSYYKNNDFGPSKSYHVLGKQTEYFGGYWHDKDFGFGHWSPYNDMPGKKLWIWSLSRSGGIWEDLLTDTDGQYVEVQSGRLYNQASSGSSTTPFDQAGFEPGATDNWRELWYPVKDIDGISTASPHAVLHLDRRNGEVTIDLMALQSIEDKLNVLLNGESIFEESLTLEPMGRYSKKLSIPREDQDMKVVLGDNKLVYVDSTSYLNLGRPIETNNPQQENNAAELYQEARNRVNKRDYKGALENYKKALNENPNYAAAHVGLANLYFRREEYQTALSHANRPLSFDTYDPDANYIQGTVQARLDNHTQALAALGWAARSMKYRTPAYTSMAQIYLEDGQLDRAIEYAQRALDFNGKNINALKILASSYRIKGYKKQARQILNSILDLDPLNHFARFEHYLLDPSEENLTAFTAMIRNELPHETFLELAVHYANTGLVEEALSVLEQAPDHPIVTYWQAFLQRDEENANKLLQDAITASPELVFPFRSESIPVLKWAEKHQSNWKNNYYLGLIYWHKGRLEEAAQLFDELSDKPNFAPFYLTRGNLRKELDYSQKEILADYQKAYQLDNQEWRTWHTIGQFYLEAGDLKEALKITSEANQKFPGNDAVEMTHARSLLYNGRYKDALNHLNTIHILPFEGASLGHTLFEQVNLLLALEMIEQENYDQALDYIENSRNWPEHLGVGKPYNPDNRLQDYLEAYIHSRRGNKSRAEALLKSVIKYTESRRNSWRPNHLISALAYRKLGQQDKAMALLKDWKSEQPNNSLANWSYNFLKGETGNSQPEPEEVNTNIPVKIIVQAVNSTRDYFTSD